MSLERESQAARREVQIIHFQQRLYLGASDQPLTVVDSELRVKGVHRLRIADASIFPTMISVNPCITCMMIGEKCADLLNQAQA